MGKKLLEVFLRTPYNYDRDAASDESGLDCSCDEGRTQQQFKEEADINTLVKRFHLDGAVPVNVRAPMVGDFTGVLDFRGMQNVIRQSVESFAEMPAAVRARFHNDPAEFVDFCLEVDQGGVPVNLAEMRKLGLAVPEKAPEPPAPPMKVEVVNPPPASSVAASTKP